MKRKIITLVMLSVVSLSLFGCHSIKDKHEDAAKKEEIQQMIDDSLTNYMKDYYTKSETDEQINEAITTNSDTANFGTTNFGTNISSTATYSNGTFTADPITWSISQDGPLTSLATSTKGIHYTGNGYAWLIGGVCYDYLPEGPGVYERTWECDGGSTVTQQVTITE